MRKTIMRFEIRAARESDHAELLDLARFLDSVNLPNDAQALHEILNLSERSFSGDIADPRKREYVFVLRDLEANCVVGTSMILGQLGRRDAPYIFFDVHNEEKYSATLDRHFIHQLLTIGYSYKGPTEVGGLVLHPKYRRSPDKLGMVISYVRFLWIAMHRADFQDNIIAELLPPLEPDGTSHLWEAIGRHFTGLSYREADRLSKRNKEFIRTLFPDSSIYTCLLSPAAQSVIGKVGGQSQGVEKMLRRVGFDYLDRIDPFDGGPHFGAVTNEIPLVKNSRQRQLQSGDLKTTARALVGVQFNTQPYFLAYVCNADVVEEAVTVLNDDYKALSQISDMVWSMPLY